MTIVPVFHVSLSALPFSKHIIQTIENKLDSLQQSKLVDKLEYEVPPTDEEHQLRFRYLWSDSGIGDETYQIRKEFMEEAPSTAQFNIEEIAKHCMQESFHLRLTTLGYVQLKWGVPSSFLVVGEKTRRAMERVVADVVWRAFKLETFPYDIFHHPSHFMQGFAFRTPAEAFLSAVDGYCRKYSKFTENYRAIHEWKSLFHIRRQALRYLKSINKTANVVPLDISEKNIAFTRLYDFQRRLEVECVDCIVNDVVLWELGDEL